METTTTLATGAMIYGKKEAEIQAVVEQVTGVLHDPNALNSVAVVMLPDKFIKRFLKTRNYILYRKAEPGEESFEYGALAKAVRDFLQSCPQEYRNIVYAPSADGQGNSQYNDPQSNRILLKQFIMLLILVASQEIPDGQAVPPMEVFESRQDAAGVFCPRTTQLVRFLLENIAVEMFENKIRGLRVKREAYVALANNCRLSMGNEDFIDTTGKDRVDLRITALHSWIQQITGSNAMDSLVTLLENKRIAHDPNPPQGKKEKSITKLRLGAINQYWATTITGYAPLPFIDTCAFLTGTAWDASASEETLCFDTHGTTANLAGSTTTTTDQPSAPLIAAYQRLLVEHTSLLKKIKNNHTVEQDKLDEHFESAARHTQLLQHYYTNGSESSSTADESESSSAADESPLTLASKTDTADNSNHGGLGYSVNGLACSILGIQTMLHDLIDELEELSTSCKASPDTKREAEVVHAALRGRLRHAPLEWQVRLDNMRATTKTEKALAGSLWRMDDFEILKLLGGGNYGRVALVRHRANPRCQVALKIQSYNVEHFIKYAAREVVDGGKVRHKNIAAILGVFPVAQVLNKSKQICLGILIEALGPNLRCVKQGIEDNCSLSRSDRVAMYCKFLLQILRAVAALNENNVFHRDIKPENICMSTEEEGVIKLIDFGLARIVDDDGTMSENCGTGPYIPPEGSGGTKHDVFSAGVTFFELLTNWGPTQPAGSRHRSNPESLKKHVKKEFKLTGIDSQMADNICNFSLAIVHEVEACRPSAVDIIPLIEDIVASFQ